MSAASSQQSFNLHFCSFGLSFKRNVKWNSPFSLLSVLDCWTSTSEDNISTTKNTPHKAFNILTTPSYTFLPQRNTRKILKVADWC